MQTTDSLEALVKPIPILQWLVVTVLCAHVVTSPSLAESDGAVLFVLVLLIGNGAGLYGLPRILSAKTFVTVLVIADTLLVPATLYATGSFRSDLFVMYFGIIMIAGAAGNLKRAMALTAVACTGYVGLGAFEAMTGHEQGPLGTYLLRIPFFLIMTLFYGAMAEYAQLERQHKERLARDVLHDELTGLPNRRYLMETLVRKLDESKRFNLPLSCAAIDLDNFKDVNDTYGHHIGDLVLKDYSSLLALESRGYDMAGRLGGDEYVWILPRVGKDDAIVACERLQESVERHLFGTKKTTFHLTTSIGLTTYLPGTGPHPSPAQVLKAADLALYTAKREGRNRVCHLPLVGPVTAEPDPKPGGRSQDRES